MTVKKGQSWGEPGSLPDGGVVVRDDAEARAVLEGARRAGRPYPPLGLLGGDLWRTLGGTGDEARLRSDRASTFTVDVGQVLVDGNLRLCVAHLVARTRLWTRALVVMNAQWLTTEAGGHWNLGPRAHPGDGLLEVYRVRLGMADLPRVRRRLHHGAHLPHPGIKEQRTVAVQADVGRPLPIRLDGVDIGPGRSLSVRVEPDALTVVV